MKRNERISRGKMDVVMGEGKGKVQRDRGTGEEVDKKISKKT